MSKLTHAFIIMFVFCFISGSLNSQLVGPKSSKVYANYQTDELGDPVNFYEALILGANYLQKSQSDITEDNSGNGNPDADPEDGGWDWILTAPAYFHTAAASPKNIYGTAALGLYYAYLKSSNPAYMTALTDAANYMISDVNIRDARGMTFLLMYQDLPGVTPDVYKDTVKARFDRRLTQYGGATGFAQYIRDARASQGYRDGIIPWDVAGFVVASRLLHSKFPSGGYLVKAGDMAEVLYQDSYNNNPGYFEPTGGQNNGWDPTYTNRNFWYYTLGITGLIDAFSSANVHTDKIAGLIQILFECRYNTGLIRGAFSHSYGAHVEPTWADDDWQTSAYAVMTLARVNQSLYQTDIDGACYYLAGSQNSISGGWVYADNTHYPSVGGEITSAIYFGECGSSSDKVMICHNGRNICISLSAVQSHLNHGDFLGFCGDAFIEPGINNQIPAEHMLYSNYPNPFNPSTGIRFDLPAASQVRLTVYDLSGREIEVLVNGMLEAGQYDVKWNAENYPSGVYIYKIDAGSYTASRKMVLLK
jgi:Secretion system C-terminal sorting domain